MNDARRSAALSDVGCKRSNNEDSFGFDEALGLYVVSDGMGGSAAGEVASFLCVRETLGSYTAMRAAHPSLASYDLLFHAVRAAHQVVYAQAVADPALRGMGATLVAAAFDGPNVVVANVGDSRAYLIREGTAVQITRDHSLVEEQVRMGLMTPEEAARSPLATTITRAMGVAPEVEPDLFAAELVPGDRLLLATDGLMRHVADPEIAGMVMEAETPEAACRALVNLTLQRGAGDNVTCLVVEMMG